jgi:hypothetical protein
VSREISRGEILVISGYAKDAPPTHPTVKFTLIDLGNSAVYPVNRAETYDGYTNDRELAEL